MNTDPTDIREETEQTEAQKASRNLARQNEEEDYRWLMTTARGRRVAWRILELTHPFQSSFTADRSATDFREGERNIGLKLQAHLAKADKQAYATMLQEHMTP